MPGRVSLQTDEAQVRRTVAKDRPEPATAPASTVLRLQRSMGNAAVAQLLAEGQVLQRQLTIANQVVSSQRITDDSPYKRRLNAVISQEAARIGLAPNAVRSELVRMSGAGTHRFDTKRAAVREAIRRLITTLPVGKLPVRGLVKQALAGLSGDTLSQSVILDRLQAAFGGDKTRLHQATRRPEFAEALLEEIRTKQSGTWVKATEIHQMKPTAWVNQELQYWNVRHYTSKFMVVLGDQVADGVFKVQGVEPPTFSELLSSITLATMTRGGGAAATASKPGERVMMTFTSGAASSGHTTGVDWKNIGNVGDTFYGLFYKDVPATGLTPAFIRDAVYYAKWTVSDFGTGWASADWLGTAAESQTERGKTPEGKARQGALADVIADIFPAAATRGEETSTSRTEREAAFSAMPNFEVKKHGPMKVNNWLPIAENIAKIKEWQVDTKNNKFIKLETTVKRNIVDTPGYALMKEARMLGLLRIVTEKRDEIYWWGERKFLGESGLADALDQDSALFAELKKVVEEEKARRAEESRPATDGAPKPPPFIPLPPQSGPVKKLAGVGGGLKKPN